MPRLGFAYDPTGRGRMSIRSSYGIFYDPFSNGSSMPMQAAISALPWLQAVQLGGPALNYTDPWHGTSGPFQPNFFPQPMTMLTEDAPSRPPYAQNWNLSIQQALPSEMVLEVRYVGTKGTRLPRFIEANPSVYRPGDSASTVDQRRIYANCNSAGQCEFASVGLLNYASNSTYHALQATIIPPFQPWACFQHFLLVLENTRLRFFDECGGVCSQARVRRERHCPEPIRSARRAWTFAFRCETSMDGECDVAIARVVGRLRT